MTALANVDDSRAASASEAPRSTRATGRLGWLWLALPLAVLVAAHVLFALVRDRPLIFADEAGYIGNARYLAGGLPIKMLKSGAYYPGYSLLLAPLFWLGLPPPATYQAILIVNGLLLSSAYVSLVYWLRWVLNAQTKYIYAVAFAASVYPAFLVQPGFAMSESAVIAVTAALPLVGFRLIERPHWLTAALFGVGTAFLYSIHPRFIGTVGTVALGLAVLTVLRTIPLRIAVVSWLTLGAGLVGTKLLSGVIKAANRGGSFDGGDRVSALLTGPGVWSLTLEVLGQYWYLAAASAGLVLIGTVDIARRLIAAPEGAPRRASPAWLTLLFTALGTVLAFCVSCAFMSEPERVDHFIYGRYNEGVVAPVLAAGILTLVQRARAWRSYAIAAGIVAAGVLGTAVVLHWARGEDWSGHANLANILALIPLMKVASGMKLVAISLVALAAYVVFSVTSRFKPWLGLSLLSAAFLAGSVLSQRFFVQMQRGRATRQVLFDRISKLNVDKISYDETYFDPVTLFFGQYFLPNTEFEFFESGRGEAPKNAYVLGHEKWPNASSFSAELIGKDKWGYSLWSAGGCCRTDKPYYTGFGAAPVPGIAEEGFYGTEQWALGPVRWTNGHGRLVVPVVKAELGSSNLFVDIAAVGGSSNRIAIIVNDSELFNGRVGRGRSRLMLPLAGAPAADSLEIKIESKTFVPHESSDSDDTRELGVAIRSMRVLRECCLAAHNPYDTDAKHE